MRKPDSGLLCAALCVVGCAAVTPVEPSPRVAPPAPTTESPPRASGVQRVTHSGASIEVGMIDRAPFRIDVPASWNRGLVLYCHGYGGPPKPFEPNESNQLASSFTKGGFAVAQSAYSSGGYALVEGARDTEALRRHFVKSFGAAQETWVTGESLGGSITMMLLETHPKTYDGGLPFCAPLGPALAYIKSIVFDTLVLFEYWFPNVMPSPAKVPADYVMTLERPALLTRLLDGNPTAAAALRRRSTARTNEELAPLLDLFTYIMGELQARWGGNPFDNRDTIYTGLGDDEAVNDGVGRYAADPAAQQKAAAYYTPTGELERPMLAVRTVYDPLISAFGSNHYAEAAQIAGHGELFAQKYVKGIGHCAITPDEKLAALEELRAWKSTGKRPKPGLLRVP